MKVLSTLDLQQNRVINVGAAVDGSDLITKDQLTAAMEGIKQKAQAKTVATANITLSGEQTIGTTAVVAGDRVLVVGQTNAAENGIYVASATAWTRSADANTWDELVSAGIWVQDARAFYRADIAAGGTLETTAISFVLVIQHSDLPTNLAKKYSVDFYGDGSSTLFNANHNLGTSDVVVMVFDELLNKVVVDLKVISANTVQLIFLNPPADGELYKATVIG